jgi:hypothetical protein
MHKVNTISSFGATLLAGALGVGFVGAVAPSARAAIVPLDPNISGGGPFTFTYQSNLSVNSQVQEGDFFTIYDFAEYSPASIFAPTGWSAIAELVSAPPPGVALLDPDDPAQFNLRFVRTGTTIINTDPLQEIDLGDFGAVSLNNQTRIDVSAYRNHDNSNPGGNPATGQNAVIVPQVIPEPTSLAALGAGLVLLTVRRRG